eukprot:TRINITY_DN185_c0_g1_i1.p1 TRINITY_DN185_c0_g1~~TRINITY_DN185_c0_g1_i1.p1  ORF type:complete len:408 (+),score=136.26 TRINITY_DN185_c0_g1_i1:81-1304(+)
MPSFWLISGPGMKTKDMTFKKVQGQCEINCSKISKFQIPDLKVGTLDDLMSLSDDLIKTDHLVEGVTRKIGKQIYDIMKNDLVEQNNGQNNNNNNNENLVQLQINDVPVDTYLNRFKWNGQKYLVRLSCREITDKIAKQCLKIDDALREKLAEYSSVSHQYTQAQRKRTGNLLVKDFSDLINFNSIVNTENLLTVYVAVPKFQEKEFEMEYENIGNFQYGDLKVQYVVPRSKELISQDNEYCLYSVVIFRHILDDFKHKCRELRYTVRLVDFDQENGENNNNDHLSGKAQLKKLENTRARLRTHILLWCQSHFSEAFQAWAHLKAVRIHVESILRFGLPANFQAILLKPIEKKKNQTSLRAQLDQLFNEYNSIYLQDTKGGDDELNALNQTEKFYPYVYLELSTDYQ